MKHLRLFPFAVALFLAVTFLTLPPYQSRAVILLPPNVTFDVSKDTMKDPRVVAAMKTAREYISKQNLSGDVMVTVTTNAPVGFTYAKNDIGVPKVVLCPGAAFMIVVQVVVVIIILGVAIYVVCKVVKWISCTISNSNWQITNNTGDMNWGTEIGAKTSLIPPAALVNPTIAVGWLGNTTNVTPSALNNVNYSLQLLSASSNLKSWTPAYDINFKCGDGNTTPIVYDMTINGVSMNPQTNSITVGRTTEGNPLTTFTMMVVYEETNSSSSGLFRAVATIPTLPK